jgi:glutamate/aspartate transport system substrate-binding protein
MQLFKATLNKSLTRGACLLWAVCGVADIQGRLKALVVLALLCGSAAGASPTLAKLRNSGVITLGYRTASPPFSFVDGQMHAAGYTVDICNHVVQALKRQPGLADLEVRMLVVTSGTRMPLVGNGSVDIECGPTTNTVERQRSISFSLTYFVAESRLLSKRSAPFMDLKSLRGRAVTSTIGTTSIQLLYELNRSQDLDMRILGGLDDIDSIRLVDSGKAVAFAMDDVLLRGQIAGAKNESDYVISTEALSVEPYGLALPPRDPMFKKLVDDALRELFKSGEIQRIYKRWFLEPMGAKRTNLKLPMSASLARVIEAPTDTADPERYR